MPTTSRTTPGKKVRVKRLPRGSSLGQKRRARESLMSATPGLPAASESEKSRAGLAWRSEEHTSELQSHSDLVCRLLLEKKKDTESIASALLFGTMPQDLLDTNN